MQHQHAIDVQVSMQCTEAKHNHSNSLEDQGFQQGLVHQGHLVHPENNNNNNINKNKPYLSKKDNEPLSMFSMFQYFTDCIANSYRKTKRVHLPW